MSQRHNRKQTKVSRKLSKAQKWPQKKQDIVTYTAPPIMQKTRPVLVYCGLGSLISNLQTPIEGRQPLLYFITQISEKYSTAMCYTWQKFVFWQKKLPHIANYFTRIYQPYPWHYKTVSRNHTIVEHNQTLTALEWNCNQKHTFHRRRPVAKIRKQVLHDDYYPGAGEQTPQSGSGSSMSAIKQAAGMLRW